MFAHVIETATPSLIALLTGSLVIAGLVKGVIGVGMALVTAWLGGEMVYRLRVGVDTDAQLNASNSLSREGPVSTRDRGGAADSAG